MMKWQPIETAPRDGTEILGIYLCSGFADYSIVRWINGDWRGFCDGEHSVRSQSGSETNYHEPFLTHWMPLPSPPEDKP